MAFSEQSKVGDLLDDPGAHAVLDKHAPELATHPMINMGRNFSFKALAAFPQAKISPDTYDAIVKDLATL
jgi:hypothetical protein